MVVGWPNCADKIENMGSSKVSLVGQIAKLRLQNSVLNMDLSLKSGNNWVNSRNSLF